MSETAETKKPENLKLRKSKPLPTKEQPQRFRNMKLYEQALANVDTQLLGVRMKKCFHYHEDNIRCDKHRFCTRCCRRMRKRRWKKVCARLSMSGVNFYSIALTVPHNRQDSFDEGARQLELAYNSLNNLFHKIDRQNERNKHGSPYVGVVAGLHPNNIDHWHVHWHIILAVSRNHSASTKQLADKFCCMWKDVTGQTRRRKKAVPIIIKPTPMPTTKKPSLLLSIEKCHSYMLNPWEIDDLNKVTELLKLLKKRRTYRRKGIFR